MKDCKRWLLVMATVGFFVLAWQVYNADATHDESSKRLDFAPVAEEHLIGTAAGRLMRVQAMRFCPERILPACMWVVTFYAKNDDGTEEEIAYATFTTDPDTGALGCVIRYETAKMVKDPDSGMPRNEILVERSFAETICSKGLNVN